MWFIDINGVVVVAASAAVPDGADDALPPDDPYVLAPDTFGNNIDDECGVGGTLSLVARSRFGLWSWTMTTTTSTTTTTDDRVCSRSMAFSLYDHSEADSYPAILDIKLRREHIVVTLLLLNFSVFLQLLYLLLPFGFFFLSSFSFFSITLLSVRLFHRL